MTELSPRNQQIIDLRNAGLSYGLIKEKLTDEYPNITRSVVSGILDRNAHLIDLPKEKNREQNQRGRNQRIRKFSHDENDHSKTCQYIEGHPTKEAMRDNSCFTCTEPTVRGKSYCKRHLAATVKDTYGMTPEVQVGQKW